MASLPPRQYISGRTRSSRYNSSNTQAQEDPSSTDHESESMNTTGTSENLCLNRPSPAETDQPQLPRTASTAQNDKGTQEGRYKRAQTEELSTSEEPRKCWICYSDETEDSPLNSDWRSPCPCALTAHEACLLDWLAELENPRSRKRNGGETKMRCPQCKSEIVIARPRSYVVDFVRACEKIAGKLVLPGLVFTFAGTIWAGCCAHGVYSIYLVFGTDDAQRIFDHGADHTWSPARNVGIPFIPLVLVFSRFRWAEGVLPAIPVLLFATHNQGELDPQGSLWPPSAAMTFAALPYVKSIYGALYERTFGKLERKWIAEVQPRSGEEENSQNEDQGAGQQAALGVGNGGILMEFDLELQIGDDAPAFAANAPAEANVPLDDQNRDGAGNGQNQEQNALGRRRQELIHDTSNFADAILGALLFPAISAGMGGLLKLAMPKSWTTPPSVLERSRAGLLQSRWGRSVIGGCLFVLLKDALVLYCRWRLAQTHRKRRVLNYDRRKGKVVR
ncbi:RING finger domain protein [Talaromyces proteolyticus]|uniref:RING finger domain protein n=1 Tax=Talaromyces proteolyticus TaxID=1131652 RepID=A0AAD4KN24_9EURO|nr:RING finger domain protein [Talaromyces proteolyticus]KAH8695347.1 RING finger domain protein [Talaromyces proteolyticus]